jgi:phosphogluconate dehydratase
VRDGDLVRVDAVAGTIAVLEPGFTERTPVTADLSANRYGLGRELFEVFRTSCSGSAEGASVVVR